MVKYKISHISGKLYIALVFTKSKVRAMIEVDGVNLTCVGACQSVLSPYFKLFSSFARIFMCFLFTPDLPRSSDWVRLHKIFAIFFGNQIIWHFEVASNETRHPCTTQAYIKLTVNFQHFLAGSGHAGTLSQEMLSSKKL